MSDLSILQIFFFVLAAFITGFTKTSVGGMGILAVLLMAMSFPGKASPGILLPMLIVADIFAVIYYRRSCQWHIIARIFPLTAIGVVIGYFIVDVIPVAVFEMVLGIVILLMLALSMFLEYHRTDISGNLVFAWATGITAGIATMMGNAAGPIFAVYVLQMGLPKSEFVGTRSWFFLILNSFKIPFSASLGLVTFETLKLDLIAIPVIMVGAYAGYVFLKMINLKLFKWLIRLAVLVAAIRLIVF